MVTRQQQISSINKTHSILIGGGDSIDYASNKTWFYNHTLKNWTSGPILMVGRSLHTAGIVRDKENNEESIVVVGGKGTSVATPSFAINGLAGTMDKRD